jgi:predicted amino acid-binding ACT domain protein
MDQSVLHVFVSCHGGEAQALRASAYQACLRSELDPYFFDWELAKGSASEAFVERRMKECALFIGIYEQDYGPRLVQLTESTGLVSALDFELQVALSVLGPKNMILFARQGADRDADLNRMLVKTKLEVRTFERDFDLLIDEAVKEWRRSRVEPMHPRTLSIKFACKDRPGILAAMFKAIYTHAGNIIRSRQTTHLGIANATVIAQWHEFAEFPTEEAVRESLLHELHPLLGGEIEALDQTLEVIRIIAEYGEIKGKGHFSVLFFDGPGIAERIFSVFAKSSTSVLESHLVQVSTAPPYMAKFVIVVDATNIPHEKIRHLARELRTQAGIVSVESLMEIGSWWY